MLNFKTYKKALGLFFLVVLLVFIISLIFGRRPLVKPEKSYGSQIPGSDSISDCQKVDVLPASGENFFILINTRSQTHVYTFNKENEECKLRTILNFKISAVKSRGNDLFLVKSYESGSDGRYNTTVYVYSLLDDDSFVSKEISFPLGIKITNDTNFSVYKNKLLFINEDDNSKITIYDYENKDVFNFSYAGSNFHSISLNFSRNKMYALTNNSKYILFDLDENTGDGKEIFVCPDSFCKFLKDDILISDSNTVYTEKNNEITKNFRIESNYKENISSLLFLKESREEYILSVFDDSTLHCFNTSFYQKTSKPSKKISLKGHKILGLGYSLEGSIVVLKSEKGINIKIIKKEDLEDIDSEDDKEQDVENDLYIISFETRRIIIKKDIKTVTDFKDNFEFGGYTVDEFKNYLGKDISGSEKIGTGSTVVFKNGDSSLEFKIIVLSDITGEGNLNGKDLTSLYDYLLGKVPLNEDVLKAADINRDKSVDTIDLLTLEKILNGSLRQ